MLNQIVREHLEIRKPISRLIEVKEISERLHSTPGHLNQDVVNEIFKSLDDMFLRLFCMGTEKSEIERFKEKSISSIVEIKKNLDMLGLKFKDPM